MTLKNDKTIKKIYVESFKDNSRFNELNSKIKYVRLSDAPHYSLVEQHDVGLPDLVWGKPEHADAAVVRLVPLQLVIIPNLEHVQCKSQHLIRSVWIKILWFYRKLSQGEPKLMVSHQFLTEG